MGSYTQKLEGTAWMTKPSWYIVAAEDRTVHPQLERFVAKRMGATAVELNSSHVPMLSQPDAVLDVIRNAVKAVQKVRSSVTHVSSSQKIIMRMSLSGSIANSSTPTMDRPGERVDRASRFKRRGGTPEARRVSVARSGRCPRRACHTANVGTVRIMRGRQFGTFVFGKARGQHVAAPAIVAAPCVSARARPDAGGPDLAS
jgi:hypothetical protein